ncbi:MAG: RNA 3'-terminal phosphate cyclase [Phycisphaerae bacterium]|nr:RNA 3'-terminal phosphate cyclase [Phycisphaerae bacterium]
METVFINGSMGEGGGQILRTSLALSCITGKRLHIENIRAARRKPGLARQHLSCVQAACEICAGQSEGAALGSQVLDFKPGPVRNGDFSFDIGSAGSASLVIQTVLPALFMTEKPSTITVTGGTHNPWAPPFDFLSETFLPAIACAGFAAECRLVKHGFFPAGGGEISFTIQPWRQDPSQTIDICEPPEEPEVHARIYTARLPAHIAHRQEKLLCQSGLSIKNFEHIDVMDSDGPGNCIMLRLCARDRTTIFTAFGAKGRPSEKVVDEVARLARSFISSGATVDRFSADQLLIYMAISNSRLGGEKPAPAKAGGAYITNDLSPHLTTNIETIKKFLPVNFDIDKQGQIHRISCAPA